MKSRESFTGKGPGPHRPSTLRCVGTLVDRLVPPAIRRESRLLRQARTTVAVSLFLALCNFALIPGGVLAAAIPEAMVKATYLMGPLLICVPIVQWLTGSPRIGGIALMALFTASLVHGYSVMGIFEPRLLPWAVLPPLLATFLYGRWVGLALTGAIVGAGTVALVILPSGELIPPVSADLQWGIPVAMALVIICATIIAASIETDRAWTQAKLERYVRHVHQLLEENPEGTALHTGGRILYANAALCTILGFEDSSPLVGRHVRDLVDALDVPAVDDFFTVGPSAHASEWRFQRTDGSAVFLEWRPGPTIDFEGKWHPMLSVRDLTDRREMQSRMVMAERMASVGTLAAGVAHEINNPLAYMMVNLEFVMTALDGMDIGDNSEIRGALDDTIDGARRVKLVVQDLKTFGRTDPAERGQASLHEVLSMSCNMAWNEIRHRAHLVREFGDDTIIKGSPSKLGQVFVNLLVNAAQSMPLGRADKGEIRVRSAIDPSGSLVVEIIDNGEGIEAGVLQRVFEPFFTTKSVGEGTGLGLSICHNIIRTLGGEIEAESEVGRGTTFRLTLPVADAVENTRATITPFMISLPDGIGRDPRVLLVDDEPFVLRSMQRMLAGFDVTEVRSGREAIDHIAGDSPFDALIVDVMMPDVSGIDLFLHITEDHPTLAERVIFITGGVFSTTANAFIEQTPNPVLFKPFSAAELRGALNKVLPPRATG